MKKKAKLVVVTSIIAVSAFIAFRYHAKHQAVEPEAVWVQTSKITESSLPIEVDAIGTLVARSVEITPEVAGHVEKIHFKDGQPVLAGDQFGLGRKH